MPLTPKLADCFDFVFVGNWILKKAWERITPNLEYTQAKESG